MTIDFLHMDGHRFEDMCAAVCQTEFGAVPIKANPGDGGIDSFNGSLLAGVDHVFQFKHFPDGIGASQKGQIRKSLKTAVKNHKPKKWTLVVPCDLDEGAQKWFEKQKAEFGKQGVELDYIGRTALRNLLLRHQAIRQEFFPNTDAHLKTLSALLGGKDELLKKPKASVLDFIQAGTDFINADNPDFGFRIHSDEQGQTIEAFLRNPSPKDATAAKLTFMFTDDPLGKKARQSWQDMHTKGTPFEIDGDHFTINQSVFDSLLPKDSKPSRLSVIPLVPQRRLPMSMTFRSKSGATATLPFIDLRLKREGSEEMVFTNEAQDHLLLVTVTARGKGGSLTFKTGSYVGRTPTEVVQVEDVLLIVGEGGGRVDMQHLETGLTLGAAGLTELEGNQPVDPDMHAFYRNLAVIEQKLDPSLRVPEQHYGRDMNAAVHLSKILDTGEVKREGTARAEWTVKNAEDARAAIAASQPMTYCSQGEEQVELFNKTYLFDVDAMMTAPVTLPEATIDDVVEGAVIRIELEGEIVQQFKNGRVGGASSAAS